MNLNLNDYKLVMPDSIKEIRGKLIAYDIEVEDDNTFFIKMDKSEILSHNCDGYHIASLIINFFYNWFPKVIKNNRLFILKMPLLSVTMKNKKRKYFYTLEEHGRSSYKAQKPRYLKGLGSNDIKDWEFIFGNLFLERISFDVDSEKSMNIAFGKNSNLRKRWLKNK